MGPKQFHRYNIIKIYADNSGTTAKRDTEWDDYSAKYHVANNYGAGLYKNMRSDIII